LVKTGQLKEHPPDKEEIGRLLTAAQRSLADAREDDQRREPLRRCIPRHHTSRPRGMTLGVEGPRVAVLDTLRRKRNLADYTGRTSTMLPWRHASSRPSGFCVRRSTGSDAASERLDRASGLQRGPHLAAFRDPLRNLGRQELQSKKDAARTLSRSARARGRRVAGLAARLITLE
jgi:hypothetical protein